MKTYCANETEFETRVQKAWTGSQEKLYRCKACGRVSKTKRQHQVSGPNTASHDKTMGFLWSSAEAERT